jgi:hypothetical protein
MAREIYEDHDTLAPEPKRDMLGTGLVITTTLVLIVAFVVMQQALKQHFGAGLFGGEPKNETPAG